MTRDDSTRRSLRTGWAHARAYSRRWRLHAAASLLVLLTASPALAVSTRDLVELSRAGLSDDVLIALIEADGTVFNLDAPKIIELRAAGLSERVLKAMLKNASAPVPADPAGPYTTDAPPPGDGAPHFVVIGERPESPFDRNAAPPLYYPWYPIVVPPVVTPPGPPVPVLPQRGFGRFMNDGWVERPSAGRSRR